MSMEFVHQTAADTTNDIDVVPVNYILMKVRSLMPVSSSWCSIAKLTDINFDFIKETFLKFKQS